MRRGFLYLVAIMDWYSRKVLAWRLSNSMDVDFCIEALNDAFANHGTLEIFNTERPHSTHGILTPDEAYASKTEPTRLTA